MNTRLIWGSLLTLTTCLWCNSALVSAQPPETVAQISASPKLDLLGDPLPQGALLRMGTLRFCPPGSVYDLALSPDETSLVTVSDFLIVWDAKTGKERWRAKKEEFPLENRGPSYGSRTVAFLSDSSHFFTPGYPNEVIQWETATGRRETLAVATGQGGYDYAKAIDVTLDGQKLALGCGGGVTVCDRDGDVLFDIENNRNVQPPGQMDDRLAFHGPSSYCRFSPNGTRLAGWTSDRPEEIRLYDSESGDELRKCALTGRLVRFAFSPNGKSLATTERDNAVRLYDVETGKQIWSQVLELNNPFENYTSGIAFSPDGKNIVAGATDHHIYVFSPVNGAVVAKLKGHSEYPWVFAFSANSQNLYSAGWDSTVRRWDIASRQQLDLPEGVRGTDVVAASPDGLLLAYADDSGVVRLVSSMTGLEHLQLRLPNLSLSQLKFSSDGEKLAGGGSSENQIQVVVWDVKSGRQTQFWKWPKGKHPHSEVEELCFTPDGNHLAAAVFRQSAAYLWNLKQGEQIAKLEHKEVYGLSFSPDGKTLATAGWDEKLKFWKTETGQIESENEIRGQGDLRMYAVCYASEGGLHATAHLDGKVRLWEVEGRHLKTEFQVGFLYGSLSFSPDGLWVATGSRQGAVKLWDPLTGATVWEGGQHQSHVYTVGFGRDSRTLVSGGGGVSYLWDLRPPQPPPTKDLEKLWQHLSGDDGPNAYQALWALSDMPGPAVQILTEKLNAIKSIDNDPQLAITVRRCVSLLSQVGTPNARKLLEDLANRDPDGDLGRISKAGLNRVRPEAK